VSDVGFSGQLVGSIPSPYMGSQAAVCTKEFELLASRGYLLSDDGTIQMRESQEEQWEEVEINLEGAIPHCRGRQVALRLHIQHFLAV